MEKDIKSVVLDCISNRCHMEIEEISLEDTVQSIIGGEFYLLPHILLDIHEKLDLRTIGYEQNNEFEIFKTVNDLIQFFASEKN